MPPRPLAPQPLAPRPPEQQQQRLVAAKAITARAVASPIPVAAEVATSVAHTPKATALAPGGDMTRNGGEPDQDPSCNHNPLYSQDTACNEDPVYNEGPVCNQDPLFSQGPAYDQDLPYDQDLEYESEAELLSPSDVLGSTGPSIASPAYGIYPQVASGMPLHPTMLLPPPSAYLPAPLETQAYATLYKHAIGLRAQDEEMKKLQTRVAALEKEARRNSNTVVSRTESRGNRRSGQRQV